MFERIVLAEFRTLDSTIVLLLRFIVSATTRTPMTAMADTIKTSMSEKPEVFLIILVVPQFFRQWAQTSTVLFLLSGVSQYPCQPFPKGRVRAMKVHPPGALHSTPPPTIISSGLQSTVSVGQRQVVKVPCRIVTG